MKNFAKVVFGAHILKESSVTSIASNRTIRNEAKPALESGHKVVIAIHGELN